jgi:hypothetical protein
MYHFFSNHLPVTCTTQLIINLFNIYITTKTTNHARAVGHNIAAKGVAVKKFINV